MRRLLLAAGMLALLATSAGSAAPLRRERIVFASEGELYAVAPEGGRRARLTRSPAVDSAPRLSPGGTRITFVSDRDGNQEIYVMEVDGRRVRRLTTNPGLVDTSPTWSPDGRRIAYASGTPGELDIYVMNADGSGKRGLVRSPGDDAEPAWSRATGQVVFSSNRGGTYDLWAVDAAGGEPRQLSAAPGDEREPAWSPNATRLAFVSNRDANDEIYVLDLSGGEPAPVTADPAADRHPSWSRDGRRIAFSTDRSGVESVYWTTPAGAALKLVAAGAAPDWGMFRVRAKPKQKPGPAELLPDLDQRAPRRLAITASRGRFLLGFASAVDNVGVGPVWIKGRRPSTIVPTMTASQLVRLSNGRLRTIRDVGVLRYTHSPSHSHWHLLRFESYELRREAGFELVVRDRKTGFCLADHYGHAAKRVRGFGPPYFRENCGKGRPDLLTVEQGSSIGYTDRYPAHYHGQNLDVTGVPPGRYVVVHRANPSRRLRERTYWNNAASVLIRLSWPGGRRSPPSVRVLAVCEGSERCGAR